jgi:hypothetical protein
MTGQPTVAPIAKLRMPAPVPKQGAEAGRRLVLLVASTSGEA